MDPGEKMKVTTDRSVITPLFWDETELGQVYYLFEDGELEGPALMRVKVRALPPPALAWRYTMVDPETGEEYSDHPAKFKYIGVNATLTLGSTK